MTDNEKRAHDLAIAITIDAAQMYRDAPIADNESQRSFDFFARYMEVYNQILECFNAQFPNSN
ncbi:MAG: hypothetical protein NC399_02900 [Muribaculum sp.]|nr:hypothetical protein [Muribaculum sp.]